MTRTKRGALIQGLKKGAMGLLLAGTTLTFIQCQGFKKKSKDSSSGGPLDLEPLGPRAGSQIPLALSLVHATSAGAPPALVRPDPDYVVRRLIRQFRPESAVVAQEIGRIEGYRALLGGASADFATPPQETYDATALLALQTVALSVCRGLVAPSPRQHPGWSTILPAPPSQVLANVTFLATTIQGLPASHMDAPLLAGAVDLVNMSLENNTIGYSSYIPACASMVLSAQGLTL